MFIALDSGNPDEVRQVRNWGFPVDKITTNPTTMAATINRVGGTVYDVAMAIRDQTAAPISVEALGTTDYDAMHIEMKNFIHEAEIIDDWGKDFVVKIPAIWQGFAAAELIDMPVNFTLVFSQHQGYLTGDHGGAYASPFVGRYDDKLEARGVSDRTGMDLVDEMVRNFRSYEFSTKILTASVRSVQHIERAAALGSHGITIPFSIFRTLYETSKGSVEWINNLRNTKPYNPDKPRRPTYSGKLEESKMKDYEIELLHEGVKKFLDDARKARYKII